MGTLLFFNDFIEDNTIANYFDGADMVALTYAATFFSQSGVLNIAAAAQKPVLVSGAPGPLLDSVKSFNLGVLVEPDNVDAIIKGINSVQLHFPEPDWMGYSKYAGWDRNINELLKAVEQQA